MPLDTNASLTDVIEKLQELEGINQKTELASVIGSPANSTDTVAQQIVKLQSIKDDLAIAITNKGVYTERSDTLQTMKNNVESISLGGITGNVLSSSSTLAFDRYSGGGNAQSYYVEVSGLNFKPSNIVIVPVTTSGTTLVTNYYQSLSDKNEYIIIYVSVNGPSATNASAGGFINGSNNAYVSETGFRLPVGASSTQYKYYAYK